MIYAIKAYHRPAYQMEELQEDLRRLTYIRRLIKKYQETGELRVRLILNHIIILSNVFGPEATTRLLFFKLDPDQRSILKTFLLYLNYLPESGIVPGINGATLNMRDIGIDLNAGTILQRL